MNPQRKSFESERENTRTGKNIFPGSKQFFQDEIRSYLLQTGETLQTNTFWILSQMSQ